MKMRLETIKTNSQEVMQGLLKPELGSSSAADAYAARAQSLLDPIAEKFGLSVEYKELEMRRLPLPKPQPPQLYARKPIRLTCTAPCLDIIDFLSCVETNVNMRMVAVESFSLQAQKDPEKQLATIVLEWPIKVEEK